MKKKFKKVIAVLAASAMMSGVFGLNCDNGKTVFLNSPVKVSALTCLSGKTTASSYLEEYKVNSNASIYIKFYGSWFSISGCKTTGQTEIEIPWKLTRDGKTYYLNSIEEKAFEKQTQITKITMKNNTGSFNTIERRAFYGCTNLTYSALKATVIGDYAFAGCSKMKYYDFSSTDHIGNLSFASCSSLENFNFKGQTIGFQAMAHTNLKSVNLKDARVFRINQSAFLECKNLKEVYLGNYLSEIPAETFASCISLEKIVIPEGVEELGMCAFENCRKLQSVTLPKSLKVIGERCFYDTALSSIQVKRSNIQFGAYCLGYVYNMNTMKMVPSNNGFTIYGPSKVSTSLLNQYPNNYTDYRYAKANNLKYVYKVS